MIGAKAAQLASSNDDANCLADSFILSRNCWSVIAVRETPTIAKGRGSVPWAPPLGLDNSYMAGMSLRCVRSPEAPKMTRMHGSGEAAGAVGELCAGVPMKFMLLHRSDAGLS